jgi:hypothetical protein
MRKKLDMNRPARKTPRKTLYNRVLSFPQAKGRTVEMIELIAEGDYHCVAIRFQDRTDLEVIIDPALTFKASLYEWKSGNQRVLRSWPVLRGFAGKRL